MCRQYLSPIPLITMKTYIHACTHIHTCVHTYIYAYTHTDTCAHTHADTHTHTLTQQNAYIFYQVFHSPYGTFHRYHKWHSFPCVRHCVPISLRNCCLRWANHCSRAIRKVLLSLLPFYPFSFLFLF